MNKNQSSEYFVGVDVGTSFVRCVVGMLDSSDSLMPTIVGHGVAANRGMRKGVISHVDDVAEAIMHALTEAERVSGAVIRQATVNVNGSHIQGMDSKGTVAISAASREITEEDRARVEEAATIVQMPANREIIQVFAREYKLDGQESVKDPIGLHGVRLEVDMHIVTASSPFVRMLDTALDKANLIATHRTVSGLAAAEAVLDRKQKESGVVVVDIGSGTTNIAVFEEGEVQHVAVLPVGGNNITNDLAIGLKTDLDIAEKVKISYAALDGSTKSKISFGEDDKTLEFNGSMVAMIVEARVAEIFEYVDRELKKISKSRKLPGGAVIIGGTANIAGIAKLASDTLHLPAKVGKMSNIKGVLEDISTPEYATATGLMLLDMLLGGQENTGGHGSSEQGFMSGLKNLFKKALK